MPWMNGYFWPRPAESKAARRAEAARAQQRAREREQQRAARQQHIINRQRASWERMRSDMARKHARA